MAVDAGLGQLLLCILGGCRARAVGILGGCRARAVAYAFLVAVAAGLGE